MPLSLDSLLARSPRALARAISAIEDGSPEGDALLALAARRAGNAMTIGVTGPPGAGKSTFVDRLVHEVRRTGHTVAVVAVDPASPFSGGAILGDRIRMEASALDPGVYLRSMSTRGHLGGVALATEGAVTLLDAAGFDVVIVETVGVGQSEIEIASLADTTVLVQPPGLGDGVQAIKAGVMEIPALFVVGKAELPGARQVAQDIRQTLGLVEPEPGAWEPPVVLARALDPADPGAAEAWAAIRAHAAWLRDGDGSRLAAARAVRAELLLKREVERALWRRFAAELELGAWEAARSAIVRHAASPATVARRLVGGGGEGA